MNSFKTRRLSDQSFYLHFVHELPTIPHLKLQRVFLTSGCNCISHSLPIYLSLGKFLLRLCELTSIFVIFFHVLDGYGAMMIYLLGIRGQSEY
jgi:hypothetical protein